MKSIFLNLPHPRKLIRRYISSYYAPNFLLPPHELLYLATIVKKWKKDPVLFIDAIAERKDTEKVLEDISSYKPRLLVTYLGHFSLDEDLKVISRIKSFSPETIIIGTGFFPTVFPEEILKNSSLDIIIRGEPELTFSSLYDRLKNNTGIWGVEGISFKDNKGIFINPSAKRIEDINKLPFPDLSILENRLNLYKEPYLKKPFTTMTTSRGCPYQCSFCIHTYGSRVIYRSLDNISKEIEHNLINYGIRNIRFLDDTFTLNKERTHAICGLLKKKNIKWTCLSRIDTLDEDLALKMKESGCQRVYLGVESGSQKILDILNKEIARSVIKEKLNQIKNSGLEISSFFITGVPGETEEDLNESISLAKETDLDYIIVKKLKVWPGTELYRKYSHLFSFSLFPFGNRFKDPTEEKRSFDREKKFYRKFYLRPKYICKQLKNLFRHPSEILNGFFSLLNFLFMNSRKKKDERSTSGDDFI